MPATKMTTDIVGQLRAQGFKLTGARKTLIEALAARRRPVSVSDLVADLAARGRKADKTTVYREVLFLQKRGYIEQVQLGDRVKRYELADGGHHHHLVCMECGNVTDVPLEGDLAAIEKAIERKTGYRIARHALEFFGTCHDCR